MAAPNHFQQRTAALKPFLKLWKGCGTAGRWQEAYFRQGYALSFNGINDYVDLPQEVRYCGADGMAVNITFKAQIISQAALQEPLSMLPDIHPKVGIRRSHDASGCTVEQQRRTFQHL